MRGNSRMNVVDGLADSMQRSWRADSQIGHGHVIIDRSNEPDDPEVSVSCKLFIGDTIFPASTLGRPEGMGSRHTL
jgi:hypothetical protein